MPIVIETPNASLAVSVAEMKTYLRKDGTTVEDDLITQIIKAVSKYAESYLRLYLLQVDAVYKTTVFKDKIFLPLRPVSSVASVKYYDSDNTLQTYDANSYEVVINVKRPYIKIYDAIPSLYNRKEYPVEISLTTGYSNAAAIPEDILIFIKAVSGFFYLNRSTHSAESLQDLRKVFDQFISKYRAVVI